MTRARFQTLMLWLATIALTGAMMVAMLLGTWDVISGQTAAKIFATGCVVAWAALLVAWAAA